MTKTCSNIFLLAKDYLDRRMTSGWQGAPYFRIYGLELASEPAISLRKTWRSCRRTTRGRGRHTCAHGFRETCGHGLRRGHLKIVWDNACSKKIGLLFPFTCTISEHTRDTQREVYRVTHKQTHARTHARTFESKSRVAFHGVVPGDPQTPTLSPSGGGFPHPNPHRRRCGNPACVCWFSVAVSLNCGHRRVCFEQRPPGRGPGLAARGEGGREGKGEAVFRRTKHDQEKKSIRTREYSQGTNERTLKGDG